MRELHPGFAKLIREEIRAGFFCDPPTSRRDQPHDIDLQRRVLASMMVGEPIMCVTSDSFYGDIHKEIFDRWIDERVNDLPRHLVAETDVIADMPVMCGKPLREAMARLHVLACLRRCADHLRKALARIEVGESTELISESIRAGLEEL